MNVSMNWIRDFVDLDGVDIDALIQKFTLATAEVEEVYHIGSDIKGVVVAKILSVEKHPDSKKLHLLKVDAGDGIYDVVCGAPNVEIGIKVPFVKDGGMVGGVQIVKKPVAGYESCGMCCSEKELGISDDHSGLMILPEDAPLGLDIKSLYEIEDTVFEVDNKSLTNRPDLWGHYGIAREFAALTDKPLKPYEKIDTSVYKDLSQVPIEIQNEQRIYRYTCLAVKNISVKKSPVNMRIRLSRCGMRAINLLADLTNYIMLELGQPMHAFDYERVSKIEVKTFDKPFEFETLDGKKRSINTETLMICSNDKPVAVAGIMGGLESEITDNTGSFLLESANFDGIGVRKSSVNLGLRTDASMRYEKILDPEITVGAIERYLKLLMTIDKGAEVISSVSDKYVKTFPKITIAFDKTYVDRYTGIDISKEYIIKTLRSLGFGIANSGDEIIADVPSWRSTKDVTIKADIIEEITRIYGYDNFEIKTASCAVAPECASEKHAVSAAVKDLLSLTFGLHEVNSYLWNDAQKLKEIGMEAKGYIRLLNSVSPDIDILRSDIISTLLTIAAENKGYEPEFGIFEIGSVIAGLKENKLADERKKLGILLYGRKKDEETLFFKAKAITEAIAQTTKNISFDYLNLEKPNYPWQHPYNCFEIKYGSTLVGEFAVVLPSICEKIDKKCSVVAIEIDIAALSEIVKESLHFNEPSKYPGIEVDLSFMVGSSTPYAAFVKVIKDYGCEFLNSCSFVEAYQDNSWHNEKSVTLRLTFGSKEKTLTSDAVQGYVNKIIELMHSIGAEIRK